MLYQRKPKQVEAHQVVVNTTMTIHGAQVDVPEGGYLIYEADRVVDWSPQGGFEANYEPYVAPEPEPEPEPVKEEESGPTVARRKRS